jgi:hypothetical protein
MPRQSLPSGRTVSHQHPFSTGNIWNIFTGSSLSSFIISNKRLRVFRLSTMSGVVWIKSVCNSRFDIAKKKRQPLFSRSGIEENKRAHSPAKRTLAMFLSIGLGANRVLLFSWLWTQDKYLGECNGQTLTVRMP